ncbi:hypothetical protein ABEY96_15320 [Priestia aryabhattai]|uniref:hypothetical protein n=1 Tax=Priestia aryabhattai TaxID=412384 RepID=UPI003D27D481
MSSKRDLEAMFSIVSNIIKNLNVNEYENILNGSATLKYVEKSLTASEKSQFDVVLKKLLNLDSNEINTNFMETIKAELETKSQLINFCNYLNIEVKTKDKKEDIYEKILNFVDENKEILLNKFNKGISINQTLEQIASQLENFNDKNLALKFLLGNNALDNKGHLLSLAKILDVNVRKESNNGEIIERIVDSVVGSKLRSMAIRGKFKKSSDSNS